jgi:alanine-glyoxylate transaminase/serine-glyoxylate transaminase/serine-pyruvate transaminase
MTAWFFCVHFQEGVLSKVEEIAAIVRRISPDTLVRFLPTKYFFRPLINTQVIVDAVCSVASEEIRFDNWDLDVVLSAGQKGLGTPPGLSILVASQRALEVSNI